MDEQPRASQTVRTLLQLRELILNGELSPGERVSELGIVERLGVSRTPVRVALVRLEEEGLVDCLPTGGFVVRAFSEADIADAIQLRGVLEGMAAQLVRQRNLTIDDFSDYIRLNDQFHGLLLRLADSPVLKRSMERVLSLPFASPGAFVRVQAELPESREILVIAQEHHRAILDAIENGEGSRADHLAREHSRLARRNLDISVKNQRQLDRVPGASLIRLRSA
jgi:GntR family transcriptional regulator, vanillate catabolism transcriptional regulator